MGAGSFSGFNIGASYMAIKGAKTIGKYSNGSEPEKPKRRGFWKWFKSLFKR